MLTYCVYSNGVEARGSATASRSEEAAPKPVL